MLKNIFDWLKSLFEDTNGVPDEARFCAVALVIAFIVLAVFDVIVHSHNFDMQQFGIGAGALSAGVGGWFKLRGAE